jgi:predicted metalloendopeptidase
MPVIRAITLIAIFAFTIFPAAAADMDRSIMPGDDFYRYANGGWIAGAVIPAGRQSYDTRWVLSETASKQVRELVQGAAGAQAAKGSITQKVGDYYASFMDESGIEAKGLAPLAQEMAKISAIGDKTALSSYLGTTLNNEVDGLTGNADHVFGIWINQGFEDANHNLPHIWQGGLGMPDRDSYIDPSPDKEKSRAQYQAHIAAMLRLAGISDATAKAERVLALEIRMAQSHAPDSDAADVFKQNNPWKRADFAAKAPGIDWDAYLASAGLAAQSDFLIWQPSAVIGTSALVASEGLDVWKDYLRFHLIEHYAAVLPKAVADEHFAFYGKAPERSESAIAATNAALPQAVGQLYTQRYFSPEAKAKAQAMVGDIFIAFRARIAKLSWMSPQTKQKALAKLAAFEIGLGNPDTWIDYSPLDVVRGDAFGNMRRAEAFNRTRDLAKLAQPIDPIEWLVNPQTPGAIIMFSPNAEFFSAAILQAPFFDSQGDDAANYGSAGAGIAHEISHSFDELGNIYDAHGRLGDWWTSEDHTRYHAATAKLAEQFDHYCPQTNLCVNGKQVLSESVADLAGLLVAHDAYMLSQIGKPDVVIDGLNGEQRFFLAFAQRWRNVKSDAASRQQIATDTHPPGEYRSDTVRNVDAWYKAFGVSSRDKLYVAPGDRIQIW